MIPRIKSIRPLKNYILAVEFEDGKKVSYDMKEDIDTLPEYDDLKEIPNLFEQVEVDESRTCIPSTLMLFCTMCLTSALSVIRFIILLAVRGLLRQRLDIRSAF